MEETKMSIQEEVSHIPNAKKIAIFLILSIFFGLKHMFNEKNDGIVKILKGNQLKQIHEKFIELNSLNVRNLISMFKPCSGGGYINNILQLKSKNHYNYI